MCEGLTALINQLLADHSPLARALRPVFATWQAITRELHQQTEAAAARLIPNPFRTDPLSPELGREVFQGRQELVRRIETLLTDPQHSASIALLGPRRCGKTSLLKMLPLLLPDAVVIFFDPQDNPVDSSAAFFQALACQAREQAQRDRRLQLPPLPEGPPFEAGSAWFQTLENLAGDHRILLCIDEFERLEDLFPGERRELLQLMGLFRATIQHRRPELQAIPPEVAELIYQRTGGQPFLLQLYGSLLINHLNEAGRRQATQPDVTAVDEQVLLEGQSSYYFRNIYRSAPDDARLVLEALALGRQAVEIKAHARRWLQRRCLITADDRPRMPVFYDWIREETR